MDSIEIIELMVRTIEDTRRIKRDWSAIAEALQETDCPDWVAHINAHESASVIMQNMQSASDAVFTACLFAGTHMGRKTTV